MWWGNCLQFSSSLALLRTDSMLSPEAAAACCSHCVLPLQVVEALRRIGKVKSAESLVRPAIPCSQPLQYRNKMSFSLTSQSYPGGLSTGYGFKKVENDSSAHQLTCCQKSQVWAMLHAACTCYISAAIA